MTLSLRMWFCVRGTSGEKSRIAIRRRESGVKPPHSKGGVSPPLQKKGTMYRAPTKSRAEARPLQMAQQCCAPTGRSGRATFAANRVWGSANRSVGVLDGGREFAGGESIEGAETGVEFGGGEAAVAEEPAKKIAGGTFAFQRVALE